MESYAVHGPELRFPPTVRGHEMAGALSPNVAKDPAFRDAMGQAERRNGMSIQLREAPQGKPMRNGPSPHPPFSQFRAAPSIYPPVRFFNPWRILVRCTSGNDRRLPRSLFRGTRRGGGEKFAPRGSRTRRNILHRAGNDAHEPGGMDNHRPLSVSVHG
jgi:hypothetical protein